MRAIHLAAMVHIIYTLTENKTPILLSSFASFITASLAVRCDSKSLPDHSRALVPFFYRVSLQWAYSASYGLKSAYCDLFAIESFGTRYCLCGKSPSYCLLFTSETRYDEAVLHV